MTPRATLVSVEGSPESVAGLLTASGAMPFETSTMKIAPSTPAVLDMMMKSAEVAPGTFNGPHGLAFDNTGALYVADTGNDVIRKFERLQAEDQQSADSGENAY